jgi:hypothetical protein
MYLLSKLTKITIFKPIPLREIEEFTISTTFKFGCAFKLRDVVLIG